VFDDGVGRMWWGVVLFGVREKCFLLRVSAWWVLHLGTKKLRLLIFRMGIYVGLGNVCLLLKLLKVLNTIFGLVPAIGCLLWLQVNSCLGKMGKAVMKAADSAGLDLIPTSFGCAEEAGKTVEVCGKEITVHGSQSFVNTRI